MLDLGFVRSNLPLVAEKLRMRGTDPAFVRDFAESFAQLDTDRRSAITEAETLQAQRNALSQQFGKLKRTGADTSSISTQSADLKARTDSLESIAAEADIRLRTLLEALPNLPQDSVPVGRSEHDNVCEKTWGTIPNFDFTPKPHWEIGEALGIIDFERAAKISGSRFVVHFGAGARLERALANFMLDLHTRPTESGGHGYAEVLPPFMVNSRSLFGTGQLPKFAEELFHCDDKGPYEPGSLQENDHWLIPTAEVPITNLFRDETLDLSAGPLSFCAWTPCFRSEAGSYGKDVRGMIRQHQFQKVELVKFTRPEDSAAEHEALTRHAETVLERLGLPYRRSAPLHRRHGLQLVQNLRPRGLGARPEHLSRDQFLLQLRNLPGPACEHPLQA